MSIDHPSSIAERVAYLARAAGSLRRLDRAAGLKAGHSQQIAQGDRPSRSGKPGITTPQADTVDKIARATGATLAWLIRGEGRAPAESTVRDLVRQAVGDDAAPADDIETADTIPPPAEVA